MSRLAEAIRRTELISAERLPLSVPALEALAHERGIDWSELRTAAGRRARMADPEKMPLTIEARAWIEGVLIGDALHLPAAARRGP